MQLKSEACWSVRSLILAGLSPELLRLHGLRVLKEERDKQQSSKQTLSGSSVF